VGAGPAGIVTPMFLARQGFAVEVVERGGDPSAREAAETNKRTFVMALMPRGIRPLRNVGSTASCWELTTCSSFHQIAPSALHQDMWSKQKSTIELPL
jgi:2-polyprenyl-6-methoxyphenol hydroxylase-like FAD-dependent oxidoreductase